MHNIKLRMLTIFCKTTRYKLVSIKVIKIKRVVLKLLANFTKTG